MAGSGVACQVITFPQEWRPKLTIAKLQELERRLRKVIEEFWREVTDWGDGRGGARIGYRVYWHPTGDVCRMCKRPKADHHTDGAACEWCGAERQWAPHLNFLIPLQGIKSWDHGDDQIQKVMKLRTDATAAAGWLGDHGGEYVTGKSSEILQFLRTKVQSVLDWAVNGLALGPYEGVNLHHSYAKKPVKIAHLLRYVSRIFPHWRGILGHLHHGRRYGLLAGGGAQEQRQRYMARIRRPKGDLKSKMCPHCLNGEVRCTGVVPWDTAFGHRWAPEGLLILETLPEMVKNDGPTGEQATRWNIQKSKP